MHLFLVVSLLWASVAWSICTKREDNCVHVFPNGISAGTELNVQAFGAKGDGMTDDGPAIQAAIDAADAAGGSSIFLPAASYFVNQNLEVGDNTEIYGIYGKSKIIRGPQPSTGTRYAGAGNCTTISQSSRLRHDVFQNKKFNCGNVKIYVHDLVFDGSQIGPKFCKGGSNVTCLGNGASGPFCSCTLNAECQSNVCDAHTAPNSHVITFSAITDTHIQRLIINNWQQDAIFIQNGGIHSSIEDNTITDHNLIWGNGSGINIEMHNTVNMPGVPLIERNSVVTNGPNFCALDLSTPCAGDGDCTTAYPAFVPATDCLGFQDPIFCCVSAGVGANCNITCGTSPSAISSIAVSFVNGTVAPQAIIMDNKSEVSDQHNGIVCNGCVGAILSDNTITGVDTRTTPSAWTKMFQGINMVAVDSVKPSIDNIIADNIILGGAVANDKQCISVADAVGAGSRGIKLQRNICESKAIVSTLQGAVVMRGVADSEVIGNTITKISANHALDIGDTGLTTSNTRVQGNVITDITGSNQDCFVVKGTTSGTTFANNLCRNAPRGIQFLSGAPSGTQILSNQMVSVTTPLLQTVTDSTIFIDDPVNMIFTAAGLPTTVNGSRVLCSDCQFSTSCTTGGSNQIATRMNSSWFCNGGPDRSLTAFTDTAATTFSNTAAEQTLSSTTDTPVLGRHYMMNATIACINTSGGAKTITLKLYIGSVAMSTTAAINCPDAATTMTVIYASKFVDLLGATGRVGGPGQTASQTLTETITQTDISSPPTTIKVTGTLSAADPNLSMTLKLFRVETVS